MQVGMEASISHKDHHVIAASAWSLTAVLNSLADPRAACAQPTLNRMRPLLSGL